MELIVRLIAWAPGGNLGRAPVKGIDQGTRINSCAGIVGGGLGGQILGALLGGAGAPDAAAAAGGMDLGAIISQIAGGGVGGGVLLAIVSVIRNAMAKRSARVAPPGAT